MTWIEALALGVLQGLTEFLPVSSSGHLALAERALGWAPEEALAFSVVVHLGTLGAVVVGFRGTIVEVVRRPRAWVPVVVATLPLGLALLIKPLLEALHGDPWLLALAFWGTAAWLLAGDPPGGAVREVEEVGVEGVRWTQALGVGCAQLVAVLPGVSRSGSTISTGMLGGLGPRTAAELSFLMAIPAILGAALVEAKEISALGAAQPGVLAVGFVSALVSGLGALAVLRWLLERRRFWVFAPYLLAVGAWALLGSGGVLD